MKSLIMFKGGPARPPVFPFLRHIKRICAALTVLLLSAACAKSAETPAGARVLVVAVDETERDMLAHAASSAHVDLLRLCRSDRPAPRGVERVISLDLPQNSLWQHKACLNDFDPTPYGLIVIPDCDEMPDRAAAYAMTVERLWGIAAQEQPVPKLLAYRAKSATLREVEPNFESFARVLFPNGLPQNAAEAAKYMRKITVPILTPQGRRTTMKVQLHPLLERPVQQAFADMADAGFPIDPKTTGGWRWSVAKMTGKVSKHAYGLAVDLNWEHNAAAYTPQWTYNPGADPLSVTPQIVAIWKKHGFHWGGDFPPDSKDPMHFCFTLR